MEEECMRDEFFTVETVIGIVIMRYFCKYILFWAFLSQSQDGIKQENSVQVYIDTFIESFTITNKLLETFKTVLINARHPLTGKLRAERIMR
jgi:hypothetical protein